MWLLLCFYYYCSLKLGEGMEVSLLRVLMMDGTIGSAGIQVNGQAKVGLHLREYYEVVLC